MILPPYTTELDPPVALLMLGSTGFDVTRVQGWLGLHGHSVMINGDFGPATEQALVAVTGQKSVGTSEWRKLVEPLARASEYLPGSGASLGQAVTELAEVHLAQDPLEIGGDNKGPWVRHYCRGYEVAWCQGFASTIWMQSARDLFEHQDGLNPHAVNDTPFELTASGQMSLYVPWVVNSARATGCFQPGSDQKAVPEGAMFFLRGGSAGYSHVGIVVADHGDTIETVEGNTNDNGSANGYEVCRRYRNKASCDYGLPAAPPVEEALVS